MTHRSPQLIGQGRAEGYPPGSWLEQGSPEDGDGIQ